MNIEKLKPFNEFNSEKSAIVNEICYRLFQETEQKPEQKPEQGILKELKKIQLPTEIVANGQFAMTIGTAAEYGNTGIVPILFETGPNALAFGRYINSSSDVRLIIKTLQVHQ